MGKVSQPVWKSSYRARFSKGNAAAFVDEIQEMSEKRQKVAIIVQRWHPTVAGGSEAHAWQYACLLKGRFAVDLLTTTALDAVSWASALPCGWTEQQCVRLR